MNSELPIFDPTESNSPRASKKRVPVPAIVAPQNEFVRSPFEAYYLPCTRGGSYWWRDGEGRWRPHNLDNLKRELRAHGVSSNGTKVSPLSDQDRVIRYLQKECAVDYAGIIAGNLAGVSNLNGSKVLVTSSPRLLEPVAGDCSLVDKFLDELFGVHVDPWGSTQRGLFDLWITRAWRTLKESSFQLGHALVLAGPPKCGKNFLQECLVTPLLGGRSVKAADYILGRSSFSSFVFTGEHLLMTDEEGGRDYRSRKGFAQRLKEKTANHVQLLHPKGREAITVVANWRTTISVNDDSEHLQTLPPLYEIDIRDKVHFFKCHRARFPESESDKVVWMKQFQSQFPAYLARALQLTVPEQWRETAGTRFGHLSFQHPGLVSDLQALSPEQQLLGMIDDFGLIPPVGAWEGSASDLRNQFCILSSSSTHRHREACDLLKTEAITGVLLARLTDSGRVERMQRTSEKRV